MKQAKRKRGRPAIPGKGKYTLNLRAENVSAFYERKSNLSQFVDEALEAMIREVKA